jgi:7-cyano-7-deazaguanine synthase in queuosine biosynthesis
MPSCPACEHHLPRALTDDQLRSARGRINAALRETRSGGRAPSCECGTCPKCKRREAMRRYRARRA